MNPQQLQQVQVAAPLIAAGLFVLALLLILLSIYYFRRSRTDFYWRSRRKAGQLGWRVFVVALSLSLVSGIICVVIGVSGLITSRIAQAPTASPDITLDNPTQEPTQTAESTLTSTAESKPTSTAAKATITTVTNTAVPSTSTRKPSATKANTATPTITFTPSETYIPAPPALTLTLESSVTPAADASLAITALDVQISPDLKPVAPDETFETGFKRIYYFVSFKQMQPGVLWRRQLLYNGDMHDDMSYSWGLEHEGNSYFFFGREEGFPPGQYEIRLFIGESTSPATSAQFSVK